MDELPGHALGREGVPRHQALRDVAPSSARGPSIHRLREKLQAMIHWNLGELEYKTGGGIWVH
jgi:hypothetical protein